MPVDILYFCLCEQSEIQKLAYLIWSNSGHLNLTPTEYWQKAEQIIYKK